ncbi:MAG: RNA polymerase sigma factor [Anaerolineales bacterium]
MASESNIAEAEQEQALVSQAIDGDADAFGTLYTRHLDAIYRYVFFRVSDVPLAEDLTEEVFVRAWTALPNYEPRGHRFTSWLYRIARNLVVDHYRKQSSRASEDDTGMENLPDPQILPEDQIANQQDLASLARAVQQLGDDEQHVIILRFVEGLSHREVAEVIGKSEGASRVIQHRALEALAELVEANE